MCSIKISFELKQNIGPTECFRMIGQGFAQGKQNRSDPHMCGTCALVPRAQLQSLMVCTGESLQWLPPQGPLNTSGHMVCLVGRERVSRTESDSSIHSQTARPTHCCLQDLLGLYFVMDLHYYIITALYFAVMHDLVHTFVQPKPLAMGYLYAALEVRPMVCGLPPWYDPLKKQRNNTNNQRYNGH